jgi:hypothetical protein
MLKQMSYPIPQISQMLQELEKIATSILHAYTEGLTRQESWSYPSVIGKLNYLAQNS